MWLWTSNVIFCAGKHLCRVYPLQAREKGLNYVLAVETVWQPYKVSAIAFSHIISTRAGYLDFNCTH